MKTIKLIVEVELSFDKHYNYDSIIEDFPWIVNLYAGDYLPFEIKSAYKYTEPVEELKPNRP